MPLAMVMMPLSAVAPRIATRVGFRTMFVSGMGLVAAGLAMMAAFTSVSGGYWSVLPGLLVLGIGVGLAQTPATSAITGSLPKEEQGVASALNDTVREFGGALGIALLGSVLSAGYRAGLGSSTDALPADAAEAVRSGIGGASVVASKAGPAGDQILAVARGAFVDGLGQTLWISAAVAGVAALVAFFAMPRKSEALTLDADEAPIARSPIDVEELSLVD
jgi:MFS family permease